MAIKLIIGLRNPGNNYADTRHNAGEWFVNLLASHYQSQFASDIKMHCEHAKIAIDNHYCKLILPTTYMNESGRPTRAFSQFYRLEPEEILVVHDELDLEVGRIKLKTGGGHGGHNGLRDIISCLGSNNFHRLRIGIGHPGHRDLVHNYVLNKPSSDNKISILNAIEYTLKGIPLLFNSSIAQAMNYINR